MKERAVDLKRIGKDFKKYVKWIVLSVLVLGVAFYFIGGFLGGTNYSSSIKFAVANNTAADSEIGLSTGVNEEMKSMQETCLSILNTESVINKAAMEAGFTEGGYDVSTEKKQGIVVEITVESNDAEKAEKMLANLGRELEETVKELSARYTIVFIGEPVTVADINNKIIFGILGGIFGLLLSALAVIIHGLLSSKIRERDDIKLIADVPVITTLPNAGKGAAIDENPDDEYVYLKNCLELDLNKSKKKSIAFVSCNADLCRDNACINTAALFARTGKNVLVIDAAGDNSTLSEHFNAGGNAGLADFFRGECNLENGTVKVSQAGQTLSLVPKGKGTDQYDVRLVGVEKISDILNQAADKYDCVFINAGNTDGDANAVLYAYLANTVIVAQTESTTLESLEKTYNLLRYNEDNVLGVVLYD